MNIFELKIWDDESERCTFYTVKEDGSTKSETDTFFERYEQDETYKESIQQLLSFILVAMGDNHGASDEFFNRYENEVAGLPSQGHVRFGEIDYFFPSFPLRLYALKITNEIVILFSGGIKDGTTNQNSSLHLKWVEACNYAKKIIDALKDGTLVVNEKDRTLLLFNGSSEITL